MHEAEIQCELKMTPMTPEQNKRALPGFPPFSFSLSPQPLPRFG